MEIFIGEYVKTYTELQASLVWSLFLLIILIFLLK